jgi:hypothetical protein
MAAKAPSIGFIILSHHFDQEQPLILRLLDRLEQFSNAFTVIHHDFSKTDFPDAALEKYKAAFVKPHVVTAWAVWPVVIATLRAMKTLVEQKPDVEWFVLLSANDYPVKSVEQIEAFFARAKYDAYIQQTPVNKEVYLGNRSKNNFLKYSYLKLFRHKLDVPFVSKKGKFYKRSIYLPKPLFLQPFNKQFHCLIGEQWFMANRRVLDFFMKNEFENSSFGRFCSKNKICPDNLFFHSLIGNNQEFSVSPNIHRFIDWSASANWHPNTLTQDYFQQLEKSDALFARKFDYQKSVDLLDQIDTLYFN